MIGKEELRLRDDLAHGAEVYPGRKNSNGIYDLADGPRSSSTLLLPDTFYRFEQH
jgi:hypothetical protein